MELTQTEQQMKIELKEVKITLWNCRTTSSYHSHYRGSKGEERKGPKNYLKKKIIVSG